MTRISFLPSDGITSKRKNVQKRHFFRKKRGWRIGAVSPLCPLARGQRGKEDNPNGEQVNLSDKRVNLIRILTKQTRKRVNPKTDKAAYGMTSTMYRVSTVYQPYIYRVCTVVVGVRTAHRVRKKCAMRNAQCAIIRNLKR